MNVVFHIPLVVCTISPVTGVPFQRLAKRRLSPTVQSFGCSLPNRQLSLKIHQDKWPDREIHAEGEGK